MHQNEIDFTGMSPFEIGLELTVAADLGKNYLHAMKAQLRRQRVDYGKPGTTEG